MEYGSDGVTICARSRVAEATCRACGVRSGRVHSRYVRRLSDGVLGRQPVVIALTVRRFVCLDSQCATKTFVEQVDGLSEPNRRRTTPLLAMLGQVGLALAGRAGARLAAILGIKVDRTTLLRLVRALPEPETTTAPAVLGVDDFALRKRHVYGTILVDIDTGKVIDLLDGREAEPLEQWLREHPGAGVICRDRAGAYAEGAKAGAPDAVQVADRWHLWRNLGDYVEKAVGRHRACVKLDQLDGETVGVSAPQAAQDEPDAAIPEPVESRLVIRTREHYAAIHGRLDRGETISAISRQLSLDRKTVRRFARASTVDELLGKAIARASLLDPFKPYLHQRWTEGTTDAAQLTKEITAQGYTGSDKTVRRYLQPFRGMLTPPPSPPAVPKVRQITGWLLRRPEDLDTDETNQLADIRSRCPHLDRLADHVTDFAKMMTNREGEKLESWLSTVEHDDQPDLHSFAIGLRRDQDAVTAGLTLPYSSGKVEGNVNRLKALKRQMYGRAKLDLLRKRVILA
ncbi:ISL3 family transposase [Saccharopolyspora pogona]|uniref:ISL3 family transposase n=1 Tax=Saccharopolyspora pogona TaxID=333966 RepID=UPI001CC25F9C|nr:ISL3 family transposase [Saccharopolyspora pogona]